MVVCLFRPARPDGLDAQKKKTGFLPFYSIKVAQRWQQTRKEDESSVEIHCKNVGGEPAVGYVLVAIVLRVDLTAKSQAVAYRAITGFQGRP